MHCSCQSNILPSLKGNVKWTSLHEQVTCRKHRTHSPVPPLVLSFLSPIFLSHSRCGSPFWLNPQPLYSDFSNWCYMTPTFLITSTSIFKSPSFSINTPMVHHLDGSSPSPHLCLFFLVLPPWVTQHHFKPPHHPQRTHSQRPIGGNEDFTEDFTWDRKDNQGTFCFPKVLLGFSSFPLPLSYPWVFSAQLNKAGPAWPSSSHSLMWPLSIRVPLASLPTAKTFSYFLINFK